jgi:hypothetical protein
MKSGSSNQPNAIPSSEHLQSHTSMDVTELRGSLTCKLGVCPQTNTPYIIQAQALLHHQTPNHFPSGECWCRHAPCQKHASFALNSDLHKSRRTKANICQASTHFHTVFSLATRLAPPLITRHSTFPLPLPKTPSCLRRLPRLPPATRTRLPSSPSTSTSKSPTTTTRCSSRSSAQPSSRSSWTPSATVRANPSPPCASCSTAPESTRPTTRRW